MVLSNKKRKVCMKKSIMSLFFGFSLVCSGGLFAWTAQDFGLTYEDQVKLSQTDGDYAFMTPRVASEVTKAWKKFGLCDMINPELECIVEAAKRGNRVVPWETMRKTMDEVCRCDRNNPVFKEYCRYLKNGDARITLAPEGSGDDATRAIVCTTLVPCPTMPPTCVNNPNQTVLCNLGVGCLQACNALIENLWVSGCIFFQDFGELVFHAADFAYILDECCTSQVAQPQAPPYRIIPAYHVFTTDVGYPLGCLTQTISRRIPTIGTGAVEDPGFGPYGSPSVDFCVPADFDDNSPESVEVDICFFTHSGDNQATGNVCFEVCFEFLTGDGTDFGATVDGTVLVGSSVTNTTAGPYVNYVATACITPAAAVITPGGRGKLVVVRRDDGTGGFDAPLYISSIVFRYPRRPSKLPFNCPGSVGSCPIP